MQTVKVTEPRVDIKPDTLSQHVVYQGAQRVNEQVFAADSWGSVGAVPTQASWSVSPPSTQTITDRLVRIKAYVQIIFNAPHQLGSNDGLRQFPLHSNLDSLTVQINGETISDNSGDHLHAMLCYGNSPEDRNKHWSTTTAQPDAFQEYSDWADPVFGGSARNPLAGYGENSTEQSRGGFLYEVVDATTIRVEITEPLLLSPFLAGHDERQHEGMINVNQFQFNLRWKSDLSQIWSHSTLGNAITSVAVSFYQAPELLMSFLTPQQTMLLPTVQSLPYTKLQDYIKTVPVLASGASTRVISDSIKLSQIPRYLFLFCRHQRNTSNQDTSDSFLSIDRVNILFNNDSGIMSTASPQDLYKICVSNGCNLTYPQWRSYRGGVMAIEFGKDIGLSASEAPGVQGQYTLQIQMDVTNKSSLPFTAEFFTSFLMEGSMSIFENGARASLGNLTQQMVLEAHTMSPEMDHHLYRSIHGGNFWSSLKSFIRKLAGGVEKLAVPVVSAVMPEFLPQAQAISTLAGAAKRGLGGRFTGGGRVSSSALTRRRARKGR